MATLKQYRKRPGLMAVDMSQSAVKDVMARFHDAEQYLIKNDFVKVTHPEHDAFKFYLQNAAYAEINQRVHADDALGQYEESVADYFRDVQVLSVRMFYYLLMICTREARHSKWNPALYASLATNYGKEIGQFTQDLRGSTSGDAVSQLRSTKMLFPLGAYTSALVDIFAKNSWGGGYGGKPWANVATVLRDFSKGALSAELMLDTAFTLAHNNGPIFNKGMLFMTYHPSELVKILDVQRAGMIPQLVSSAGSPFVNQEIKERHQKLANVLGECFTGNVDWNKVEKLGAVHSYSAEKKKTNKGTEINLGPMLSVKKAVRSKNG